MRIAIFTDNFYPELSGITDFTLTLGRELAKRGHNICYFVPAYGPRDYTKAHLTEAEINLGANVTIVRVWSLPLRLTPTAQGRLVLPSLWRWWKIGKFKPDIIHVNVPSFLGLDALLAARFWHIPIIGTSHTPIKEFIKYYPFASDWLMKLLNHLISWFYNRCAFVTGPSQFILNEMKQSGFDQRSRAISNPIDIGNFTPVDSVRKSALKKVFGLNDFTVLYTGRLAAEKHVDIIIKAFYLVKKEIPQATLAITGHGQVEQELKSLTDKMGLTNSVKFLGTLSFTDLVQLYQASDVFAVASTAETQCISMMQAMASGLPVIGVRAGGLPEYITDQTGFIVDVGDYKALADWLVSLYRNKGEADRLKAGGLFWVKNFSIEKIVNEWENLFSQEIDNYHAS